MWWSKKNCFHISWKSIQLPEFVCDTPCCRCFHSLVWEPCLWLLACCFPFPFALLFHLPSLWLSPCISRVACFWIATAIALHLCLAFCLGFGPAFACWFQWQLLVVGITLACYGWAWWSGDWEQALVWRPFGWYTGDTCVNPLLKRGNTCVCDKPLTQVHFVVFLHFVVAPNWSLFSQVGAQGHFVVYNASKNVVAFLAHLIFSQLYKGNSNPYFQRIQHGHVSIFRCEVLIHLSADRGWRERFWHVNFGRHACWESTVRSHHVSDRRNLHCLASSWTSHGSRNSWVYQQGPLVSAFFCGRIMCRLDSFWQIEGQCPADSAGH